MTFVPAKYPDPQHSAQYREDSGDASGLLLQPKIHLFPATQLPSLMRWPTPARIGGGLHNMGNTCFLNSVLQCLTYTPPLANFCRERRHSLTCHQNSSQCVFCAFEQHVRQISTIRSSITPTKIVGMLKVIAKHMKLGRQEDSHEFLRYFLETLQRNSVASIDKSQYKPEEYRRICETSFIHQVFGAHLRSQVKCAACGHASNTLDPFLDLSLELQGCNSLMECLQQYTKKERLDKQNLYKCEKCHQQTRALKQLTIHTAPYILTVQFKRFKAGGHTAMPFMGMMGGGGSKITKHIAFSERLQLGDFMSHPDSAAAKANYTLFGVVVHQGSSTRSGHYYAFVKAANGSWHELNDEHESAVSLPHVLKQQAYILFYAREMSSITKVMMSLPAVTNEGKTIKLPAYLLENKSQKPSLETLARPAGWAARSPGSHDESVEDESHEDEKSDSDVVQPKRRLEDLGDVIIRPKPKGRRTVKFFRTPRRTGTSDDGDGSGGDDEEGCEGRGGAGGGVSATHGRWKLTPMEAEALGDSRTPEKAVGTPTLNGKHRAGASGSTGGPASPGRGGVREKEGGHHEAHQCEGKEHSSGSQSRGWLFAPDRRHGDDRSDGAARNEDTEHGDAGFSFFSAGRQNTNRDNRSPAAGEAAGGVSGRFGEGTGERRSAASIAEGAGAGEPGSNRYALTERDGKRQRLHAAVVRSWERDERVTQFGAQVDAWETVDAETKVAQATLLRLPELLPDRPVRDEWDIEYDKGKVKKVKSAEPTKGARHHFDRFYDNRKKFMAPGKRANRLKKGSKALRPFKRWNKGSKRDQ